MLLYDHAKIRGMTMTNKILHDPLPEPNMKIQTALLRRAIANARKTTTGRAGKQDPVYLKFKLFVKKMDETLFIQFRNECEKERMQVFTKMEDARTEHMHNAASAVKDLRKEASDYDEIIKTLVEKRNATETKINQIVKGYGLKWQDEEKKLNDDMNFDLEAIAKKYRGLLDDALRRELPEYCG